MDRRRFLLTSLAGALAAPLPATAHVLRTIALLSTGTDPIQPNPLWSDFLDQLKQLGYVEGQNIVIERRFGGGRYDRLTEFVTDLGTRRLDAVVATGDLESLAAKRSLPTTPVVMMLVQDPVNTGLVASLARPGGNVTGLTTQAPELYGKRLDLLKETLTAVARVGVLFTPTSPSSVAAAKEMATAAKSLTIQLRPLELRDAVALDNLFAIIGHERLEALVVITDAPTFNQRARIAELAVKHRVATMCEAREFVSNGCLVAYGPSYGALARRAAFYVDRILKGAKPAELPVERPTTFELVINLKTAKALGLTIPPSLLARADQVID